MGITPGAAAANIEDFFRRVFWEADGAVTRFFPSHTMSYCGLGALYGLNHLWLHTQAALDSDVLDDAAGFFNALRAEYSVIHIGNVLPMAETFLELHGYRLRFTSPIMALEGELKTGRPLDIRAQIRAVRSLSDVEAMRKVMETVFCTPPLITSRAVRPEHISDPAIHHYLAWVDGMAVASVTVMVSHGIAGIWNVGTLPEYRRHGLASALMSRALTDAAKAGARCSILMASLEGYGLYRAIGYRVYTETFYHVPHTTAEEIRG